MYDELIKSLRDCAEVNSLSLYKRGLMKQAADAIEKMSMRLHGDEAAIAGMKREIESMVVSGKKPRWIPVTERLPELHDAEYLDEVTGELIRYKESKPIMIWLEKGGFMDIGVYEKSDAVDDFCYQGVPATVTYWHPLPEPPKEE